MKYRYFSFFPEDWRGDVALRLCSLAARGLWMEMICEMHSANPYGHLVTASGIVIETPGELAQITGQKVPDVRKWLQELERAEVFSRTDSGLIYSRRMVRDEMFREGWRERQRTSRRGRPAPGNDVVSHAAVTSKSRVSHASVTREIEIEKSSKVSPLSPRGVSDVTYAGLVAEVAAMRETELRDLTPAQRAVLGRYHVETFGAPDEPESERRRRASRLAIAFAKMGLTPDLGDLLVDEYLIAASRYFADQGGLPWFRPFDVRAVLPAEILERRIAK